MLPINRSKTLAVVKTASIQQSLIKGVTIRREIDGNLEIFLDVERLKFLPPRLSLHYYFCSKVGSYKGGINIFMILEN